MRPKLEQKTWTSVTATNIISSSSKSEIRTFCQKQLALILPVHGGRDFHWDWKTPYGSFTRRLSKYASRFNIKILPSQLSLIGNLAKQDLANKEYELKITDKFNWRPGDYGDRGSCFWTCHSGAKAVISDLGGRAVLLRSKKQGAGRSWLLPYGDNAWAIFNTYGVGLTNSIVARLLADKYQLEYKPGLLSTHGDIDDGVMYLNNDGHVMVIAQPKALADIQPEYDLSYDRGSYQDYRTCTICNKLFHADDLDYEDCSECDNCHD